MTSFKLLRAVRTDTRFHTTWRMASVLSTILCGVSFERKCTRHTWRIPTSWNIGWFTCDCV